MIHDKIGCQIILTLCEDQNMAQKVESIGFKNYYGREDNQRNFTETSKVEIGGSTGPNVVAGKKVIVEKEPMKKPPYNPYAKPMTDKCYRCQEVGHRSNNCPRRRPVNMTEHEEGEYTDGDNGVCEPLGKGKGNSGMVNSKVGVGNSKFSWFSYFLQTIHP